VATLAEEQRGPVPKLAAARAPGGPGAPARARGALAGIGDGVVVAVDAVLVAAHRRRNRGEWGRRAAGEGGRGGIPAAARARPGREGLRPPHALGRDGAPTPRAPLPVMGVRARVGVAAQDPQSGGGGDLEELVRASSEREDRLRMISRR